MQKDIKRQIEDIVGDGNVYENELMAPHMSMKVGGYADLYVTPSSAEQIKELMKLFRIEDVPYYVLGNGTNVIIRDEGYRGVIISTREGLRQIRTEGNNITAGAGISLKEAAEAACRASLSGMEFASGIPGSLGGAVTMNAGAYDGEMKDIITTVYAVDKEGNERIFSAAEADFSYRHSIFSTGEYIVTAACITLKEGDISAIRAKMDELNARRAEKQPLEYPSCGSTFKRPEGHFAGKLIMDSHLAGARVGGASVSRKHCGFVINDNNANAADVLGVIKLVQDTVKEQSGIELECEVRVL